MWKLIILLMSCLFLFCLFFIFFFFGGGGRIPHKWKRFITKSPYRYSVGIPMNTNRTCQNGKFGPKVSLSTISWFFFFKQHYIFACITNLLFILLIAFRITFWANSNKISHNIASIWRFEPLWKWGDQLWFSKRILWFGATNLYTSLYAPAHDRYKLWRKWKHHKSALNINSCLNWYIQQKILLVIYPRSL